jgi:hypothetical protein
MPILNRNSPVSGNVDRIDLSLTQWKALRPMLVDRAGEQAEGESQQDYNERLDAAAWEIIEAALSAAVQTWHADETERITVERTTTVARRIAERRHAAAEQARIDMATYVDLPEEPTP